MAIILHLETTAAVCSVALSRDGQLLAELEHEEPNAHSRVLPGLLSQVLDLAGLKREQLNAVSLSAGPGSYTGLRIGSSTAKGIAYGLGLPLLAVPTLAAMAGAAFRRHPGAYACVPMMDARRMEVYTAAYGADGRVFFPPQALVVKENFALSLLETGTVVFCGNGVEKCADLLHHKQALSEIQARPRASDMVDIAHKMLINRDLTDLAYFEPHYLKDFWTPVPPKTP